MTTRIAITGPYFYPQAYGVEKVMYNHAKHLAARGHDVHVLSTSLRYPQGVQDGLLTTEKIDGFTIHRLPVLLRAPWRKFFIYQSNGGFLIPHLSRLLSKLEPDIVHTHNIGAAAWARAGARYAHQQGKRFFYSPYYHAPSSDEPRRKLHNLRLAFQNDWNRFPLKVADRIFHQARHEFDSFEEQFPYAGRNRYTVLPNGIDPPKFHAANITDKPWSDILFVGRVDDPRKGFVTLVEAMRQILATTSSVRLTVVGTISSETRSMLEKEFNSAISICGSVSEDDLERAYSKTDLFVMPSIYEGFGMPYIEAMRYGLPVIGTRVGGIPEVVPPGTGLLIPPADPNALVGAITQLLANPTQRAAMGAKGREWSSRFLWPQIVDQLEGHYGIGG